MEPVAILCFHYYVDLFNLVLLGKESQSPFCNSKEVDLIRSADDRGPLDVG